MSESVAELFASALRLSEADRAGLATRLLDSLDPASGDEVDGDSDLAERLADLDAGRVRPVPWDEARRVLREDVGGGDAG